MKNEIFEKFCYISEGIMRWKDTEIGKNLYLLKNKQVSAYSSLLFSVRECAKMYLLNKQMGILFVDTDKV